MRIDDDIIADTDVVATEISFEDIVKVLGSSVTEALQVATQGRVFR